MYLISNLFVYQEKMNIYLCVYYISQLTSISFASVYDHQVLKQYPKNTIEVGQ